MSAHIGGIRTGNHARIMLNGTRYEIGEEVAPQSGLRFVGAQNNTLRFRDENGIVYTKSF